MQAVCPKCNTLNPISNQFCGNCGASLESAKVVQEAQPAKVESQPKRSNLVLLLILLIAIACAPLHAYNSGEHEYMVLMSFNSLGLTYHDQPGV